MNDPTPPNEQKPAAQRTSLKKASLQPHLLELLEQIKKPGDVRISVEPGTPGRCSLTVAAIDQRGFLSVIAGLLAAHDIIILKGALTTHVFQPPPGPAKQTISGFGKKTWSNPPPPAPVRKILDTFEVSGQDIGSGEFWDTFADDLALQIKTLAAGELNKVRQDIIDRFCTILEAKKGSQEKLLPITIEVDNRACADRTVLRILSKDTPGFLFSFANALTMLEINIEDGEILTVGSEVQDTFWILDSQGRKITDEEKIHQLRAACALIKQFTYMLPMSANPGQALRQFGDLVDQVLSHPDWAQDLGSIHSDKAMDNLAALMGVSQFLWEDFLRMQHENLFPMVSDPEKLEKGLGKEELEEKLREELATVEKDEEKLAVLNEFKDRQMFRIDLRHITKRSTDIGFSEELSDLTDVVVRHAMEIGFAQLVRRYGRPVCNEQRPCRWAILCAGKSGGREMGFASDIELLIVYESQGQTDGETSLDNAAFFEKLVRFLLQNLKTRQEGIFQIDLQLRPYGNKGSLACSLGAFKEYYSSTGPAQQFERMALVKLRPEAGDTDFLDEIIAVRDAFVYSSKPLDYENIRYLRKRQVEELVKLKTINPKFSSGALVDIEYFIQAKQIEVGAENENVRVTKGMVALRELEKSGAVTHALADDIRNAYRCLRRTIDALRAVRGHAKDLTVPEPDSPAFIYLARRLGYETGASLAQELDWSLKLGRSLWETVPGNNSGDS
jgi:[glutamine synthetase] adenylyltransferase / [glutamine synthetase]-adenylyl-L-tyrosine phosphorylase